MTISISLMASLAAIGYRYQLVSAHADLKHYIEFDQNMQVVGSVWVSV